MLYVIVALGSFLIGIIAYMMGYTDGKRKAREYLRKEFLEWKSGFEERANEIMDIYKKEMLKVKEAYDELYSLRKDLNDNSTDDSDLDYAEVDKDE